MSELEHLKNETVDPVRGLRVGEMHARREKMEDGKRYIIYYTFGDRDDEPEGKEATAENV